MQNACDVVGQSNKIYKTRKPVCDHHARTVLWAQRKKIDRTTKCIRWLVYAHKTESVYLSFFLSFNIYISKLKERRKKNTSLVYEPNERECRESIGNTVPQCTYQQQQQQFQYKTHSHVIVCISLVCTAKIPMHKNM